MPIYSYHCSKCNQDWDVMHSADYTINKCKLCESTGTVDKKLSMPTISKKKDTTKDYIRELKETIKETKTNKISEK